MAWWRHKAGRRTGRHISFWRMGLGNGEVEEDHGHGQGNSVEK